MLGGFGGIEIRTSLHLPMDERRVWVRSRGHPLVYWLSRQLARIGVCLEPDVVWQITIKVPGKYVLAGGVLYCHPAQVADIRRMLEELSPGRSAGPAWP